LNEKEDKAEPNCIQTQPIGFALRHERSNVRANPPCLAGSALSEGLGLIRHPRGTAASSFQ
jgi:hypothetical protein